MAKLKGKAKAKFLAMMASGRKSHKHNKAKSKSKRKSKHKEHNVAKKRHHKAKKSTRRRHHSSAGGLGKWVPDHHKLIGFGTAFAYGKAEAALSKDPQHFLAKVPTPFAVIGRAGNLGAMVWLGGVITRHPVVKAVAAGILTVAAYQNGRSSDKFSAGSQDFKLSGPGRGRDEMLVDHYLKRRAE